MTRLKTLANNTGRLHIDKVGNQLELQAEPSDKKYGPLSCLTTYSVEFIEAVFAQSGAGWTCDEILRDTDASDAQLDVRLSVQAYFTDSIFKQPVRILDYGCGGGSSTAVLARLFPHAEIVACDFDSGLLNTSRLRKDHYQFKNVTIVQCPKSGEHGAGEFDLVFLNAVYEHLMPTERAPVMRNVLTSLKAGGSLILNQTPHRWFPVDTHTTGIPLLNYVPRRLAHMLANRKGFPGTWDALLRQGIRGGTIGEIMRHAKAVDSQVLLRKPIRVARSWAGIWYAAKRQRASGLKRTIIGAIGGVVDRLHLPFAPYINIVVTRERAGERLPARFRIERDSNRGHNQRARVNGDLSLRIEADIV